MSSTHPVSALRAMPYLLALAPALLVGAVIFLALGASPLEAFGVMADGAFGSWFRFSEVLVRSAPMLLTGLAVCLAAQMSLWNVGAEGQLVMGATAAAGVSFLFGGGSSPWMVLPVVMAAGFLGGAAWAAAPGVLKARLGVNEVITTLLLNYVAIIFMEHLYFGPWRDPAGFGFPGTAMLVEAARLPRLPGTRIHLGLLLGLGLALLVALLLGKTKWGYEVRIIGRSAKAARYAGMGLTRRIVAVMLLSGGIAGLAGMAEVCGIHYRLQQGVASGYGYDGIIVACLARFNPLAAPLAAVALGSLFVGGEYLQSQLHMPSTISLVLEGVILLGFLGGEAIRAKRANHLGRTGRTSPLTEEPGGDAP